MKSLVLGSALLLATSTTMAGTLVPNKKIDINFPGYCDGMYLDINQAKGTVTGYHTGCKSEMIMGTVGANSKIGSSVTMYYYTDSEPMIMVIDDAPKRWVIYRADGSEVNSGSYAKGVANADIANSGLTATDSPQ